MIEYEGGFYDVPKGSLREGQVYRWTGRRWVRDRAEEKRRLAAARQQLQELPSGPSGNFSL